MRRLLPVDLRQHNFGLDEVYTVPELDFPEDGVALTHGGRRPYVYFNMVSSIDGKATTQTENAGGLGSKVDRHLMGRLRLAADAVMAGAETIRRDPFVPDTRPELAVERALYFPDAPHPLGVTLSRDGNLPQDRKFFRAGPARRLIFLSYKVPPEREAALSPYAQIFKIEEDINGNLELGQLLKVLYDEFGVRRLLCEGGPSLNFALLSKGFGDEFFWTLGPKIVGGRENHTLVEGPGLGLPPEKLIKAQLKSIYEQESELFMRYKIENQ
jgi:2,5-diamino-6-(ribosylamino)-4(3H)-pyrimidinone 5'-phosphate reductase